jgi:hypothetical protein
MSISPIVVLAVYRVAERAQPDFFRVIKDKREYFAKTGYTTSRPAILLQSTQNREFLIDIFEWASEQAIERAHSDPIVLRYWSEMENLWIDGGLRLSQLPESEEAFAGFAPIEICRD